MRTTQLLKASICILVISIAQSAKAAEIDYSTFGDYAKYGSTPDVAGTCSYEAIGKKDYMGAY